MQMGRVFGWIPEGLYNLCWLMVQAVVLAALSVGCFGIGVDLLVVV